MFAQKLLKIIRALFLIILIAVLLLNLYTIFSQLVLKNDPPMIFGYSRVAIISGSMSPAIEVGDLIIIKDADSYQINDIVTFRSGSSLVTHRIIALDGGKAITKGDFNNVADKAPIEISDIVGKFIARIPHAGDAVLFLRSPLGVLVIIVFAIVLIELPYLYSKRNNNKKGMDNDERVKGKT